MEKYESYETGDTAEANCFGDYVSSMTFIPEVEHNITRVILKLIRLGSPPGYRIAIYKCDANHKPIEDELTGVDVDLSEVTPDPGGEWVIIDLPSCLLEEVKEYAITMWPDGGTTSNQVKWRYEIDGDVYVRGMYVYSTNGGDTWTAQPIVDMMFQEWGGPAAVPFSKAHIIG